MTHQPWTLYWQADHASSCVALSDECDALAIDALWHDFARDLSVDGREDDGKPAGNPTVLDLATGNGAVPRALLQGQPALVVTAVDQADIDPLQHLNNPGDLSRVTFMPAIDICDLPFEDETFDAVTSQFGLEYAPLEGAVSEAVRVLRPGGRLGLLVHHEASEIVRPAAPKLVEMARLLGRNGLLHTLHAFVHEGLTQQQLEAAGRTYLAAHGPRTRQISGQIFSGIDQVIKQFPHDAEGARDLVTVMRARVAAERVRLSQMQAAALGVEQVAKLALLLERHQLEAVAVAEFKIAVATEREALVGWRIAASKCSRP